MSEPVPPDGAAPITARILIADDEPRNLLAVSEILAGPGIELVTVGSGEEALRRVLRDDFAAILLDVRMPRMDGYEAAAMIRARPRSSRVPLLFMTAYNKDDLHVFRGYSAGAVDYVFKPIEPVVLKSKVEVFVDLYRKTEEIKRQHAAEKHLLLENLRVRGEKLDAEKALRRGEQHQSLVLRELPVALYTAALDGAGRRLRFTDDSVEVISGYPAAAFHQAGHWHARLHAEDLPRVEGELRALAEGGSVTTEYRWRHPDGSERHVMDRAVAVLDEGGAPREVFGMWFDVTDRKELESRLMHASKLEAVGRLTGGIAHDFNNMLNVVMGNLDLLHRSVDGNDKALKRLQGAIDGAQRCADLTARLLAFSRRSHLQAVALDPAQVMPGVVDLLRRTLGERVEVALDLAPDLPPVRVDPSQFESALVNLAVNARDAMPEGGCLRVDVARVPSPEGGEAGPGGVAFTIADTGTGMEPAVLQRVFEPFFTTKEKGKGTGLGLSMVYGFVQQSDGQIDIRSEAGHGTAITIRLPACAENGGAGLPVRPGAGDDGEPMDGRGETVLLVEDDRDVRQVASAALRTLGFAVREAETGDEAAVLLDGEPDVRLVVSDVRMPGRLNGIDLGRLVRRRWPAIPVLLTSGFVDDDQDFSDFEFLQKPYRVSDLIGKLKAVLNIEPAEA